MIFDKFFYDVIDIYLVVLPLALLLGGLLKYLHHSRRKKLEQLDNRIKEFEGQVVVVMGDSVPGKKITRVIGPVVGFSDISSENAGKFQEAEREAMLCLIKRANDEGANGVIDLKMKTGGSEQSELDGRSPKVTYMGTAVVT